MSKEINVVIAIPNEGHTQVEAYANRLENFFHLGKLQENGELGKLTPRFRFHFVTLGRIFTPLAREEAANLTLEIGADYLYMIDDDMICPNNMFELLFKHNVDIVAPLAFTRNFPHHAVIYDVTETWDGKTQSHVMINHFVEGYKRDSLVQCDAVGFGAALIKAEVLKQTGKGRFMSTCGTGEDIYFCHQAKKKGFKVFMDTSLKIGHLSHPIEVTEDYVKKVRTELKYEDPLVMNNKYKNGNNNGSSEVGLNKNEALLIRGD